MTSRSGSEGSPAANGANCRGLLTDEPMMADQGSLFVERGGIRALGSPRLLHSQQEVGTSLPTRLFAITICWSLRALHLMI